MWCNKCRDVFFFFEMMSEQKINTIPNFIGQVGFNEEQSNINKVIMLSLHIKLGLMKQFVKLLPKYSDTMKYMVEKFLK